MKYVLVDKGDNVVDRVELGSGVGVTGARTFFVKRKQIDSEKFDQIWKVMSEDHYETQKDLANRQNKQYEWWKEDKDITDSELKY